MNRSTRRTQRAIAEVDAKVELTGPTTYFSHSAKVVHPELEYGYKLVYGDTVRGLQSAIRRALVPVLEAKKRRELQAVLNTAPKD